ncbi:lycopene cyclase domain-containing protein [uncultured Jatrophihabitans sp.]|uniref:lycopene cyclase domain-containing protein n=1 Tax=uncultured Jatrophihabitans sp. TaxID=1610747 RepID=UPI0035C9FA91
MGHGAYLLILAACLVGTLPLELVLRVRVYARWRRLLAALLPVAVVFTAWDVAAIHAGWWRYDPRRTIGVTLFGRLPLEELLFFLVIPVCAVLTLEAVRARRPTWLIGDELSGDER